MVGSGDMFRSDTPVAFSRVWAMPNGNTFDVAPIGDFVRKYLERARVSVDPFARDKAWCTFTNDINPATTAKYHLDAEEFLRTILADGVSADLIIIDPPYSPRQISECYKALGKPVGMVDTQNAVLYKRVRDAADLIAAPNGVVLSFGWNSAGMGLKRGYRQEEILIVCHGSAHNDTICLAERKC